MRLKTEIGDTIETIRVIENGSGAGTRLPMTLPTEAACRFADKLIRGGGWRIVETDPRYMECPPDCDCERCDERNRVPQFGEEQA